MKQVHWFPGHMAKARRELSAMMPLIDIVIELVDARIPSSSSNPMIKEICKKKPRLVILNKAQLADSKETKKWMEYYKQEGLQAIDVDLVQNYNVKKIVPLCHEILKEKKEKDRSRGLLSNHIRAMIVGIPNVGKSTFINKLSGRKGTMVGDRPGVTKGQTWIKVDDTLELLDTPGILWPKFDDPNAAMNLALCGAIKDDILPLDDIVAHGIKFMMTYYPEHLKNRYEIEVTSEDEVIDIFDKVGERRKAYARGNMIDYDRVVNLIIYDIRQNKLGGMTFDRKD